MAAMVGQIGSVFNDPAKDQMRKAAEIFDIIDQNGDGVITQAEFAMLQSAMGTSQPAMQAVPGAGGCQAYGAPAVTSSMMASMAPPSMTASPPQSMMCASPPQNFSLGGSCATLPPQTMPPQTAPFAQPAMGCGQVTMTAQAPQAAAAVACAPPPMAAAPGSMACAPPPPMASAQIAAPAPAAAPICYSAPPAPPAAPQVAATMNMGAPAAFQSSMLPSQPAPTPPMTVAAAPAQPMPMQPMPAQPMATQPMAAPPMRAPTPVPPAPLAQASFAAPPAGSYAAPAGVTAVGVAPNTNSLEGLSQMFDMMDKNGDGVLTREEFNRMQASMGLEAGTMVQTGLAAAPAQSMTMVAQPAPAPVYTAPQTMPMAQPAVQQSAVATLAPPATAAPAPPVCYAAPPTMPAPQPAAQSYEVATLAPPAMAAPAPPVCYAAPPTMPAPQPAFQSYEASFTAPATMAPQAPVQTILPSPQAEYAATSITSMPQASFTQTCAAPAPAPQTFTQTCAAPAPAPQMFTQTCAATAAPSQTFTQTYAAPVAAPQTYTATEAPAPVTVMAPPVQGGTMGTSIQGQTAKWEWPGFQQGSAASAETNTKDMFSMLDLNGDGVLTRDEFERATGGSVLTTSALGVAGNTSSVSQAATVQPTYQTAAPTCGGMLSTPAAPVTTTMSMTGPPMTAASVKLPQAPSVEFQSCAAPCYAAPPESMTFQAPQAGMSYQAPQAGITGAQLGQINGSYATSTSGYGANMTYGAPSASVNYGGAGAYGTYGVANGAYTNGCAGSASYGMTAGMGKVDRDLFDMLDVDRDGVITREEFDRAIRMQQIEAGSYRDEERCSVM